VHGTLLTAGCLAVPPGAHYLFVQLGWLISGKMKIDPKNASLKKSKKKSKKSASENGSGAQVECPPPKQEVVEADATGFAKNLASNKKSIRDQTMNNIIAWLRLREKHVGVFQDLDLMLLWKGLFYCLWMSDKVPVQQELAEQIAQLSTVFRKKENSLMFIKAFFVTMLREWGGLDKYRLDKFYSLVRYVVRESLKLACGRGMVSEFGDILRDQVLMCKPDGLRFHLCDIYLDELDSSGCSKKMTSEELYEAFSPFFCAIGFTKSKELFPHIMKRVFEPLLADGAIAKLSLTQLGEGFFAIAADGKSITEAQRTVLYEMYGACKAAAKLQKETSLVEEVEKVAANEKVVEAGDSSANKEKKKKKKKKKEEVKPSMNLSEEFDRIGSDNMEVEEDVAPSFKKSNKKKKKKTEKKKVDSLEESSDDVTPKRNKKGSKVDTSEESSNDVTPKQKKRNKKVDANHSSEKKTPVSEKDKKRKHSDVDSQKKTPTGKKPSRSNDSSKKIRFDFKQTQKLDHHVSIQRLQTTPVKPAELTESPRSGLLKVRAGAKTTGGKKRRTSVQEGLQVAKMNTMKNATSASANKRTRGRGYF